jgi:pimeloyl-ACP methyl ester carboxylesterase
MPDRLPDDPAWGHGRVAGSGEVMLHYIRLGAGDPVLLLHGWPGFSYDWRRVLEPLSGFADVIAPDFRGFGESDKPDLPPAEGYTPEILAEDLLALLDALGISRVVVGAYDIGATVAQTLARDHADRVRALALFNPAYPGIGGRRFDPSVQREFWYQHFHALAWSDRLIAHDRETVRLYLEYFYDHWCGRKEAIREPEFEAIVDVYARPGAVRASIAYYRARAAQRQTQAGAQPEDSRIRQPTVIAWGELDPVILAAWADRLGETFLDHELSLLPGIGHFVPIEAPEQTIETIRRALALARQHERGRAEDRERGLRLADEIPIGSGSSRRWGQFSRRIESRRIDSAQRRSTPGLSREASAKSVLGRVPTLFDPRILLHVDDTRSS